MTLVAPYSDTVMLALQRQQAALVRIDTEAMAPGKSLNDALEVVTEALSDALEATRVGVWFLDEDRVTLGCADLFLQQDSCHESGLELKADQYPCYFAALTKERAIDAHDASTDPRTCEFANGYLDVLGISSMLDAPIRRHGQVVGVICIEHQGEPRRWRLDEVLCAGAAGDQVAKILITEERREVASELALRDEQLRQMQKMDAIGQLAGGIAHDFNNMLAGIMGSAGLLELCVPENNAAAHRAIDLIHRSSSRAEDLVKKLLSFSRKSKELAVPFDVHSVLDDAITLFQRGGGGGIQIVREMNATFHYVDGDAVDIQNAFLNLCINAGDAMPDGGTLSIATGVTSRPRSASQSQQHDTGSDDVLVVTISDTGSGIAPEALDRIFEPFFTTKAQGKGIGLGLAAVYAIVRNHDGSIEVDTAPGEGTSFKICLPLCEQQTVQALPIVGHMPVARGTRVLVVDDEESLQTLASMILEGLGCHVSVVSGGQAAVDAIAANPAGIDLVVLDMIMPVMSGEECFHRLREINPRIPVLVTTGFAGSSNLSRILRNDATGVLYKPYTRDQFAIATAIAIASAITPAHGAGDAPNI